MDIQGLGVSGYYAKQGLLTERTETDKTTEENGSLAEQQKAADRFEKSKQETETVTYTPPKKLSADARKSIDEQRAASYQNMIMSMLGKQGEQFRMLSGQPVGGNTAPGVSAAAAAIAPGGKYSVDAVSTRLLDMAKSLSGGDPSKISLLRDAVKKGFAAAGVEMGGKLPSISHETLAETMKRFDEWEQESKIVA